MAEEPRKEAAPKAGAYVRHAEGRRHGLLREFFDLLRYSNKWWLAPIIIGLLLASVVVMMGGSILAPFLYTLF